MKENGDMPVSYEHEIKLINDNPVSSPARRLPYRQRDEISKQVNALLDKNYIAPLRSAYASPIVPVSRKDGSTRMCLDYRKLNKKTVKCNYPVAHLEDLLEGVCGYDTFLLLIWDKLIIIFLLKLRTERKQPFLLVIGSLS